MTDAVAHLHILRRWNSFTPLMPPSDSGPGGGYFLEWQGRGLVIDPGFDFLANFRSAGLEAGAISGVVVSHGHVDHARDLESILTGKFERLSALKRWELSKEGEEPLDMFMSLDAYEKYGSLIRSQGEDVTSIPRLRILTPDSQLNLRERYGLALEIIQADHSTDDTPWLTHAVGLVFHLYDGSEEASTVGFPGDTRMTAERAQRFQGCDVVVGHLGGLNLSQLLALAGLGTNQHLASAIKQWAPYWDSIKADDKQLLANVLSIDEPPQSLDANGVTSRFRAIFEGDPDLADGVKRSAHSLLSGLALLFRTCIQEDEFLGIVSEFGLELGAFRHKVAEVLDSALCSSGSARVLTGDIGLSVSISRTALPCDKVSGGRACGPCDYKPRRLRIYCAGCKSYVPPCCVKARCIRYRGKAMDYKCLSCSLSEFSPPTPLIPF